MNIVSAPRDLDALMPMHLRLAPDGKIVSAGRILRRVLGDGRDFDACFVIDRSTTDQPGIQGLSRSILLGERIFLRLRDYPAITLRGQGIQSGADMVMNFGFGISLVHAVRELALTDADFAPSDLAMEFLFLHEANQAVMGELTHANRRLEQAREAAQTLAVTDPLTGLLNRRGFQSALEIAARNVDVVPFALGQLDLDYFKQVNDLHGHAAGDEVLQHVAHILRSETRSVDIVGRVGGDEFLLLLSGPGTAADLQNLARRIISRIEAPIHTNDAICLVSASLGFSLSRDYVTMNTERMLADADSALYSAKQQGRAQAHFAQHAVS